MLEISKQLFFRNKNTTNKATICFYKFQKNTQTYLHQLLHIKEINRANSYSSEIRRDSYLLGRISGKLAIKKHLNLNDTQSFYIDNGIFFQPIIIGLLNSPYLQVSLSHTQNIGVAIVSEERHPIGIDIESLDHLSSKDVMDILSQKEKSLPNQPDPLILWTAKESLSKLLKTGLTIPFEWFEVEKIIQINRDCYEIYFLNFKQVKAMVLIAGQYVVSCSYHIHSTTNIEELLDIQNSLIEYQTT